MEYCHVVTCSNFADCALHSKTNNSGQDYQGSVSYQGAVGWQGDAGRPVACYQGWVGYQGSVGYQGDIGDAVGWQGYQGSDGYQGAVGWQGDEGPVGHRGDIGIRGPTGFNGHAKYCCDVCPDHETNDFHLFAFWFDLRQKGPEMIVSYVEKYGSLPCYILDHIPYDKRLIALCKQYGATCCKESRSNLARVLLGIELVDKTHQRSLLNRFDRCVELGLLNKVSFLIRKGYCQSNNIKMYDDDLILQAFLIRELCRSHLYKQYSVCIADMIGTYTPWKQVRRFFATRSNPSNFPFLTIPKFLTKTFE